MPQYQGVWTLPVAARLQSNQQWATDPLYRNTTLLLQADNAANGAQNNTFLDSSSNNFTITRNGNTTQGTFTPFSQSPGWWSNFFNGGSDDLSLPTNAALAPQTSDFCFECWIYRTEAFTTSYSAIYSGDANSGIFIGQLVTGLFGVRERANVDILSRTSPPTNKWVHIAITRSGSSLRMFYDGVQQGATVTNSTNFTSGVNTIGLASGASPFYGYISNLRFVKGSAVYTSNFTPSPIPLTAITNTSLLTCQSNRFVDNSTNNFALTRNGNVSVQAFSPFAPQYQYTPSVTGGSGYFDGTGDYLNLAVQSFTGDFTVEAWIYPTRLSDSGGSGQIFSYDVINIQFATDSAGNLIYYNNSISTSATAAISLNSWQHVALCRSGSTTRIFVNGTLRATNASDSGTRAFSAIGQFASGGAYLFQGYMSSVRWAATAVYTAAFTPPTAPLTAITNTQLLLNFTNAGIYDGTLKNNLETVGNAQVSTSVVKYGTGSMAFDGTGDYLTVPANAAFNFGTGNFTVEFWLYFQNSTGFQTIFDINYTTSPNLVFQASSGAMAVYMNGASTVLAASAVSNGTWNHFALVRSGTTVTLYLNGVSVSSATYSGNVGNSTSIVYVGGSLGGGGYYLNGYIDDLRITAGIARYTANFTPPTVALPRQ